MCGHPAPNAFADIPFATGSLGHGLGLAAGMALARKLKDRPGRVYCLTSDGEWNEGSSWESLLFARHHDLPLTLIVDANGLQGFGTTTEVSGLNAIAEKFRCFGWPTVEVDGHDVAALQAALSEGSNGVRAVVANTRKGRGVSFMENAVLWHYRSPQGDEYAAAMRELGIDSAAEHA